MIPTIQIKLCNCFLGSTGDYIITFKQSAASLPVSAVNHADSLSASRAQVPHRLLLSSTSIRALGNVRVSGG